MDMRIPDLEWLPASLLGWFAETTAELRRAEAAARGLSFDTGRPYRASGRIQIIVKAAV